MARTQKPSDWLVLGCLSVIFITVACLSNLEKALAFSVTLGVFAAVVQTKWDSRDDPRMWVLIAVVAVIQTAAIFFLQIPRVSAGLVCLPFAMVEGYALWGILGWIEKRYPRGKSR